MKLDISHFKKVHEDHKTATLRHDDGHEIKVAKSSLTPALKAKLARLPAHLVDGGEVFNPNDDIIARMNQPATSRPTEDWGKYYMAMKEQQNAKDAERFGGAPDIQIIPSENPTIDINEMPQPNTQANQAPDFSLTGAARDIATAGVPQQQFGRNPAGMMDFMQGVIPQSIQQNQKPGVPPTSNVSAVSKGGPSFGNAALMGTPPRSGGGPELQAKQAQGSMAGSNIMRDFAQVEKGARDLAKAEGDLGRQESLAADKLTLNIDNLMAEHKNKFEALNNEINNTVKDIQNSKIDPDNYWDKKSTPSKIGTAIGLILGGMGAGLLKQENPALKFLNNNIEKDIAAQKENLGKKNSILAAYMHQTKDLTEATAMTRAFYLEKYANDIHKAAALSKDPMAKARADQTIGKLNFEKHQILNGIAEKQTKNEFVRNAGGTMDPSQLVAHVVPKEHQKEVFKEIAAAQNTKNMSEHILEAFDKAVEDYKSMRTGYGLVRESPHVLAFQQALGPTLANLEGNTAVVTFENLKKNLTPKGMSLDSTFATQRKAVVDYLRSKSAAPTAKGYGIDLSRFQSTAPYAETKIAAPEGYKKR